jgi:ubiquinone/menaquinone biosynthesis C-methylase UbiE
VTSPAPGAGVAQSEFWNGAGGAHWLALRAKQDLLFAPVSDALFARAKIAPGERTLDIGCGCGETTIEAARRVGAGGKAVGLDIAAPLIDEARRLAPPGAPIEFVLADAATHPFAPSSFDALISRFGVMFFANPVAAFANLRRALRRGGRAVFACWREAKRNPWQMVPLRAALRHAPRLPELGPEEPSPFSFADEARVQRILAGAGFAEVTLTPYDVEFDIALGRGLESALHTALSIGAAMVALEGQPEDLRAAATQEIRAALAPLQRGQSVPLAGAIWIVEAINR